MNRTKPYGLEISSIHRCSTGFEFIGLNHFKYLKSALHLRLFTTFSKTVLNCVFSCTPMMSLKIVSYLYCRIIMLVSHHFVSELSALKFKNQISKLEFLSNNSPNWNAVQCTLNMCKNDKFSLRSDSNRNIK